MNPFFSDRLTQPGNLTITSLSVFLVKYYNYNKTIRMTSSLAFNRNQPDWRCESQIFIYFSFPQQNSYQLDYMSSRSLTGLDLTGLAVSCPDTIESTRKPDETTRTRIHVQNAHIITCPGVFVRVHARGAKSQAKGPKANKEQEERSSRKLTSHFIPLPSASLSLSAWADAGIKGESCS